MQNQLQALVGQVGVAQNSLMPMVLCGLIIVATTPCVMVALSKQGRMSSPRRSAAQSGRHPHYFALAGVELENQATTNPRHRRESFWIVRPKSSVWIRLSNLASGPHFCGRSKATIRFLLWAIKWSA